MPQKRLLSLAALTFLIMLSLSILWEFFLEDVLAPVFLPGHPPENLQERWESVIVSVVLIALALIMPTWLALKSNLAWQQAEAALQESEAQLRLVVDNLPALIVYVDSDQRYRLVNETCADWFGRPAAEIIGKQVSEIHGEHYAVLKPHIDAALSGEILTFEAAFVYPDGKRRDIRSVLVPHVDPQGTVRGNFALTLDITQSKRVESEHRFQANIIETMEEGVVLVQLDNGELVYANPKYEAIFGYGPGEMNGKHGSILNAGTDDEKKETARIIMAGINETGEWRGEVHSVKKDGTTFWCYTTMKIMDHPEYGPVAVSIHTDITDRKRAEEELRESEARYRALFELSPDAVYVHQNGRIIFANASTMSLLAASGANDIVGKPVLDFVAPVDHARVKDRVSHTLTTGQATPLAEFKMVRLDGVLVDVAVAGRGIKWKGGSAVLVVVRDVSEQKTKEREIRMLNEDLERRVEKRTEELQESETRIRAIVEYAPVNIAVKDMDGRHILIGPQLKDLFGVAAEEALGKTSQEFLTEELAHSLTTHDRAVLESGQASEQEDEVPLEDGIHTILTVKFPIPDAVGGYVGIGAISSDITERKRLESELLRQERLAALGQLTATVSHELRNPLGVIRASAFIVREGLNGEDPRVQRSLERIERSIIRCDRIIDELLYFTRISEIRAEPTAIDAWLDETLNEQTVPSAVRLRRDFGLGDMTVSFDRDRFRRAIINVFDNGCQAMTGDGREDTGSEERNLTVWTQEHDGRVEVIFEDTGPGIPPDVYERIFEPLYSTKGFGVGLGLPVVKQIMEQHSGGVEVESEEGRGTRVCLWLPTSHSTD